MKFHNKLKEAIDWRTNLIRYACSSRKKICISEKEAEKYVFCFNGEFGFETVCWAPYLKYLREHLNFKMTIAGRHGGQFLYPFADNYVEIASDNFVECLGNHCIHLPDSLTGRPVFSPISIQYITEPLNRDILSVGGIEYPHIILTQKEMNIEKNYSKLDFSFIADKLPFVTHKRIAVICNKYYYQGAIRKIYNGYDHNALLLLRDFLIKKGFFVVYNAFPEPPNEGGSVFRINVGDMFQHEDCFDMSNLYAEKDTLTMNRLQISIYNKAAVAFATQGGTSFLPALCHVPTFYIMKEGSYNEGQNLQRLSGKIVKPFYEVKDFLPVFDQYFSPKE